MPCPDGEPNWRCPHYGWLGSHWYVEEIVVGECVANALQGDEQFWSAPGRDEVQA